MRILTNSRILRTITLLIAIFSFCFPAEAKYSGGTGEPNDPYQIATAEDLIALGEEPNDYDKHFIMTEDIDLSGYTFDRAVIAPDVNDSKNGFQGSPFTGTFNGDNHTISHLTITGDSYLGLFGQTDSGARISNLGLEAVDVNGTGNSVGGLVGENEDGSITNCYSTGSVSGDGGIGGLVGSNLRSITSCYSTGSVSGNGYVGGLVGYIDDGSIGDSYCTGTVSGTGDSIGGLVGFIEAGSAGSCFWDMETSGQIDSVGGIGLTTNEMQTASTFLEAGWDFVNETDNGTEDIWWIDEGLDYPRLWWELIPEN